MYGAHSLFLLGESGHGSDGRIVRATQISQKCIKIGTHSKFQDTDIRYEICLLINYLFTVPMERLGSFRAVRGGDGSDVLFLCQYCELL